VRTLDAIALAPGRWGGTPVFCYGFDDLDALQINAIETLAHKTGTAVVVSLPGEPGRIALAGRAGTLEALRPAADEIVELAAQPAYYEEPVLHHLERSLFEPAPTRSPDSPAVRLLEGGDQRAEAELIAEEIAELVAGGFAPSDIAIVTRADDARADVLADALDAVGIAHSRARRERLGASAVGSGLLALLRCAAASGDATDLVAWLGAAHVAREDGELEEFEAVLRRRGATALGPARDSWERQHGPLVALRELEAAAAGNRGAILLDAVAAQLEALLAAPWRRSAALLDPWEAAAAAAARRSLSELAELARSEPRLLGGLSGIIRALEEAVVELPGSATGAAVSICGALSLRARRVRALFICSAQDGDFPASAREPAFLGSAERAELARASGLVLAGAPDQLAAERYLFYALCSRPTARLRISWHTAGDDGEPALRSLFVDELRDCFAPELFDERRRRAGGALTWEPASAVPAGLRELERLLAEPRRRAAKIAPLRFGERLLALRGHAAYSASALERWASCPVAWLVERGLRAKKLEPDSIYLLRGSEAHEVLAAVFEGLRDAEGSARLDARTLPLALELLDDALARSTRALSPRAALEKTERRRLRLDLERYLSLAAASPSRHEPAQFELGFGLEGAELPAAELGGGLVLCGYIDRVDVDPSTRTAIVFDYKTGSGAPPWKRWASEHKLQQGLYMRVAEQLLGVEAVGGLYQPLRSSDLQPRGAILDDAVPLGPEPFSTDRVDAATLTGLVDDVVAAARAVADEIERGALEPRPVSCRSRGGCLFPTICRCEVA
jgi:RecB family exonuclease